MKKYILFFTSLCLLNGPTHAADSYIVVGDNPANVIKLMQSLYQFGLR